MKTTQPRNRDIFAGGDPGASFGALAAVNKKGNPVFLKPLPNVKWLLTTKTKKGNQRTTKRTDEQGLRLIYLELMMKGRITIGIEDVGPLPPFHGPAASFILGDSYGNLRTSAAWAESKILLIPAKIWQAEFFKSGKSDKDTKALSVQAARRLFPKLARFFKGPQGEGFADALLIAEYTRRKSLCLTK